MSNDEHELDGLLGSPRIHGKSSSILTKREAHLVGARILAQVFLEFLKGNFSSTDERGLKELGNDVGTGPSREVWFEASGVLESGEYLHLSAHPFDRGWEVVLEMWKNIEEFGEYRHKYPNEFLGKITAYPEEDNRKERRFRPVIDVRTNKNRTRIIPGFVSRQTRVWFQILNRVVDLSYSPGEIDSGAYRRIGWEDWTI